MTFQKTFKFVSHKFLALEEYSAKMTAHEICVKISELMNFLQKRMFFFSNK